MNDIQPNHWAAHRYTREYFGGSSREVAKGLLGARLFHSSPDGRREAFIIETEAYGGESDSASHARFGKTKRNQPMFGPPGHAYIYMIYGIHLMLNIVTGKQGDAQAVLIRAVADSKTKKVFDGPGKVSRYLSLSRELNGVDVVVGKSLGIFRGFTPEPRMVISSPRIGIQYSYSPDREAHLRFRICDTAVMRYIERV